MASRENDILRDAVIETEKEIFAEALGQDALTHDETGDRSQEEIGEGLEGQHEPDEDEDEEEGKDADVEAKAETTEPKPEPKGEDDPRARVPAHRLREQTERTRAIEAERDALKARVEAAEVERRKEIDALRAEFQAALRQPRADATPPKPAEPPKPDVPPDLFENPQAFAEYVTKNAATQVQALQQQMDEMRINMSMENAHARHGATFDAAFEAAKKLDLNAPQNREIGRRIRSSPNPGEALVQWHKQTETLREVGADPAAYKARIAEETRKSLAADPEFRKQLLDDLRAEAMTGDDGAPRTTTRLPRSLNRANGSSNRASNTDGFDLSPQGVFDSVFADR